MPERRILVFVKLPLPGQVKTRLADELGLAEAVELYDAMVRDQVDALAGAEAPLTLCHAPIAPLDAYRDWLGRERTFQLQEGDDLGERMAHAFETAFAKGADRVLLTGSDLPEITPDVTAEAFAALDREGAALSPSDDGGYTLIGFSREAFARGVFDDIPWSTPDVLQATLAAFERAGQAVHLTAPVPDLDTPADLAALTARHDEGGPRRTLALARRLLATG